jgi:hypothetical protein
VYSAHLKNASEGETGVEETHTHAPALSRSFPHVPNVTRTHQKIVKDDMKQVLRSAIKFIERDHLQHHAEVIIG